MTKLASILLSLAAAGLGTTAMAAPAAEPAAPAPAPAPARYSTAESALGDLLDNPATKAVLATHIPALIANEGISQARGMTLKTLQNYAGDMLSDEVLARIDADLAKIK